MVAEVRKGELRDELISVLEAELESALRAHGAALEGATHSEAKAEGDKDTRALEQSYIARGQARRVEELRGAIADMRAMPLRSFRLGDPVALGALVDAEEGGQRRLFFLAMHGGGASLAEGRVQVLTPQSPLGRALLGKCEGDDCEAVTGPVPRELVIVKVE